MSRINIALTGFLVIIGFFLIAEHWAHLYGYFPFLLLLACPFLHLFGHGGHDGHGGRDSGAGKNPNGDRPSSHHHHDS